MAGPLFAELQNADSHQPLLMEVKLRGCIAINWFCPTDSRLQTITGPGTACQDKWNARGKKGPVRTVSTGVLSLIREGMTPSRTRNFVNFSETLTLTRTIKTWIMYGEHTSNATIDHETTEEHDCHIITGNMSGETTSNRKRKQETTDQCDHLLENARETA